METTPAVIIWNRQVWTQIPSLKIWNQICYKYKIICVKKMLDKYQTSRWTKKWLHCKNNSIFENANYSNRRGCNDWNVAVKEEGISREVIQWVLFQGSREIRWPCIRSHRGWRLLPCKVQVARPSIVQGSNSSALVITEGTRGERKRQCWNCAGTGEQLACSPFNLGNTLCLTVQAWNTPNIQSWKQDRQNRNNNNS